MVINNVAETGGFLEPEKIVRFFDLEKGDHVADFGAGHGFFTIPMARIAGGNGKVYAIDIQKSVLDIIRAKAKVEHLLNVEPIWADLDEIGGSRLKDDFIDFVTVANILFQAEKKDLIMREAYRILRPGGRMAVVEWDFLGNVDTANYKIGPPQDLRINKEAVKNLALQAGFKLDREFAAGSHHYGLLFIKKG